MSNLEPINSGDMRLATVMEIDHLEELATDLLAQEPTEIVMTSEVRTDLGNRALLQLLWEEQGGKPVDVSPRVGLAIQNKRFESLVEFVFTEDNESVPALFEEEKQGDILRAFYDLQHVESVTDDFRSIMKFFRMVVCVSLGQEGYENVSSLGGIDGSEKHIADRMRQWVLAQPGEVFRSSWFRFALGDPAYSTVGILRRHGEMPNIDGCEPPMHPDLRVEVAQLTADTGRRYLSFPDHDKLIQPFTPSTEEDECMVLVARQQDADDYDEEETDPEREEDPFAPLAKDVRFITGALQGCLNSRN